MTRTSPRVAFGLYAMTIKPDSTPACPDVQSFSKVNDLKSGVATTRPYITYEPDFWLLDGGYKFKPVDDSVVHVGLWSLSQSDENGDFDTPPVLTITFGSVHDTDGLTLRFAQYSEDYAVDIDVAYYNASNVLIQTDNYIPSDWEFSTSQAISDFKKIIITFNSTNKPFRYLRLTGIDFGELTYFESADIKSGTIIQEINPISVELPIDTVELTLFSDDADFSIINPGGAYALMENKQPIDVYEVIDNRNVYLGQFYIDERENISGNEIKLFAISKIGILDKLTSDYCQHLTESLPLDTVLSIILDPIDVAYEIDDALSGATVTGLTPIDTFRNVLQQIAFSCGAYITCARSGVLQFKQYNNIEDLTTYDFWLTRADKGNKQSLSLKPLITGVQVSFYDYVYESGTTVTVYEQNLPAGTHFVVFSEPINDIVITGGSAVEPYPMATCAMIEVATPGTVTVEGHPYTETKRVYTVENLSLPAGVDKKYIVIDEIKTINSDNVEDIAQRLYDYCQQRYLQKFKLYASEIAPSELALIDTYENEQLAGILEKISIDLTGGFVSNVEFTGIVAPA